MWGYKSQGRVLNVIHSLIGHRTKYTEAVLRFQTKKRPTWASALNPEILGKKREIDRDNSRMNSVTAETLFVCLFVCFREIQDHRRFIDFDLGDHKQTQPYLQSCLLLLLPMVLDTNIYQCTSNLIHEEHIWEIWEQVLIAQVVIKLKIQTELVRIYLLNSTWKF